MLDATGSYHREIARQMGERTNYTTPLMRLRDPDNTKVILVTLAEQTPVLEAASLQADLERADIHPWAWVINNSLAAARPTSPLLRQRALAEAREIDCVTQKYAERFAVVPMLADEPVGVQALLSLSATPTFAS